MLADISQPQSVCKSHSDFVRIQDLVSGAQSSSFVGSIEYLGIAGE